MRILAINNYSLHAAMGKSAKGIAPYHHCWGIDYLMHKGHEVDTMLYSPPKNRIKKLLYSIIFNLRILKYIRKYNVVITFANPIIGHLALLKSLHLLPCKTKLYTLVHHLYPKGSLLFSGYDKIFFLSSKIMEYASKNYPTLKKRFYKLDWGPDLPFYERTFLTMANEKERGNLLISTGKTARDIDLITPIPIDIGLPVMIITDTIKEIDQSIKTSGKKGVNPLSYKEILTYMEKATISAICIIKENPSKSLSGLTSFLDACTLGTPIIMSDNTNIGIDIEALQMGYCYSTGNYEDFKQKLKMLISDESRFEMMKTNCRKWALENSYENYCRKLYKEIIDETLE